MNVASPRNPSSFAFGQKKSGSGAISGGPGRTAKRNTVPDNRVQTDWTENTDPGSGKKYYYNTKTRQSVWEMPPELAAARRQTGGGGGGGGAAAAAQAMAAAQKKRQEEERKKKADEERRKKAEEAARLKKQQEEEAARKRQQAQAAAAGAGAASDWTENTDPGSGKKYYYNAKTGVSSWEMPPVDI